MGVSYYDTPLPVREPGVDLRDALADLRLPYWVLASVGVPAGRVVVAFVSDSARLSRMLAANWAQAGAGEEPDATLYAIAGGLVHHHEAFFNGSLILTTKDDKLREERRYRRLLFRTRVSWINNCETPEDFLGKFISTVMK